MALPDPYIRRNPNDLITAGDWNDIQSQGRQELRAHTHRGGDDGTKIPREGIVAGAIDGTLIDAAAKVTVSELTITSALLKVQNRDLPGELTNLTARASAIETRVAAVEGNKLDRTGGTVSASLTVNGALTPSVGNEETKGIFFPKDPGGGGGDRAYIRYFSWAGYGTTPDPEATKLTIGIDNDANDVLVLRQQGAERLVIASGNVGINMGATAPGEMLSLGGTGSCIELGAGVSGKEANAGKIAYAKFAPTTPSLELVGGGGPGSDKRRITMWAEAGAQINGPLKATGGVVANGVNIGRNGASTTYTYPYETIGTDNPGHNLRLHSGGSVVFHAASGIIVGNDQGGNGNIRVAGLVQADKVRLGDKWVMSAVGDAHGNDEWLRLFNTSNTGYYGGLAAGKLYSISGALSGSDVRLKKNVRPLEGALDKIAALRAVRYEPREPDAGGEETRIGLLAHEVEAVFPEVVGVGPDGMKGIDYARLVAPLIDAINELRLAIAAAR